jgi:hypothetical protein
MGLDTKTYWLTDRQSQCDVEDFDFTQLVESRAMKRRLGGWCEMATSLGVSWLRVEFFKEGWEEMRL